MTVPFLQPIFQATPISSAWHWLLIALLALTPVTIIEIVKLIRATAAQRRN